jgi:hypothetical protein
MPRASVTRLLFLSIALAVLVGVVYAPVRNHEFVAFDDYDFIVDNAHVTAGLTADSVDGRSPMLTMRRAVR